MKRFLYKHRFLFARRIVQLSLLSLYFMANYAGWKIVQGNLSSSVILGTVPMSDPFALLQIFASGSVVAFNAIIGAVLVFLVYGLFLGRMFCSWVCPVNMVTDLANYLRRVLGLDSYEKRFNISRSTRYWFIALSLVLSMLFLIPAFEFISPISMLHRGVVFGIGFGWAAVLIVFLFDLFVQKNGFCGHICPLGGFYSLITRFSLIRVFHHQDRCTLCMKCKHICPEKEVLHLVGKHSGIVAMGECINCGRCIEVCDDDAMEFSIRSMIDMKLEEKERR